MHYLETIEGDRGVVYLRCLINWREVGTFQPVLKPMFRGWISIDLLKRRWSPVFCKAIEMQDRFIEMHWLENCCFEDGCFEVKDILLWDTWVKWINIAYFLLLHFTFLSWHLTPTLTRPISSWWWDGLLVRLFILKACMSMAVFQPV